MSRVCKIPSTNEGIRYSDSAHINEDGGVAAVH